MAVKTTPNSRKSYPEFKRQARERVVIEIMSTGISTLQVWNDREDTWKSYGIEDHDTFHTIIQGVHGRMKKRYVAYCKVEEKLNKILEKAEGSDDQQLTRAANQIRLVQTGLTNLGFDLSQDYNMTLSRGTSRSASVTVEDLLENDSFSELMDLV